MPIDQRIQDEIHRGQHLRGWITNAYAQIEYMLGDLILRCRCFPEYADQTHTFSHSATKRVEKVRAMLQRSGQLDPYSAELASILDRFEDRHETRNLLVHGFCTYLMTPKGDAGFEFQKWHRADGRDDARLIKTFRLSDLMDEERSLIDLCGEAQELLMRIHRQFGWIGRPTS